MRAVPWVVCSGCSYVYPPWEVPDFTPGQGGCGEEVEVARPVSADDLSALEGIEAAVVPEDPAATLSLALTPDWLREAREVVFQSTGPNLCEGPRHATVIPVTGASDSEDLRGSFAGELTVQEDGQRFLGGVLRVDPGFGIGADWARLAPRDPDCAEGPTVVRMFIDDGNDNSGMVLPLAWPEGRFYVRAHDGGCRSEVVVDTTFFEP